MIAVDKFTNQSYTVVRGDEYPYVVMGYMKEYPRKYPDDKKVVDGNGMRLINVPFTRDEFLRRFRIIGDGDESLVRIS